MAAPAGRVPGDESPRGGRSETATALDPATRELEDERDFLLRSLQDLEVEHDAHDIDDLDYQTLKDDYTARAAAVLRALAASPAPCPQPESVPSVSLAASPGDPAGGGPGRPRSQWILRHRRKALSAAGVLIVLGGVLWAVVGSASQRQAGETISGQQAGNAAAVATPTQVDSQERKLLVAAQKAADRGDNVTELKDAQAVLAGDPTQPQALTMEGWLLAQTGRKALVEKGVGLLTLAERIDPGFAEPHVYRGIALLSEGNDRAAVPELRWYLSHKPDPKLAPKVHAALAKAEAALGKSSSVRRR